MSATAGVPAFTSRPFYAIHEPVKQPASANSSQQTVRKVCWTNGSPICLRGGFTDETSRQSQLGQARDPRVLGVASRRLLVRKGTRFRVIEVKDDRLTGGFHAFEADSNFRWTDGEATITDSPVIPNAKGAFLVGNPSKAEVTVLRVKLPPHCKHPPHSHPFAEVATVLSGRLGYGLRGRVRHIKRPDIGSRHLRRHAGQTIPLYLDRQ